MLKIAKLLLNFFLKKLVLGKADFEQLDKVWHRMSPL